MPRYVALDVHWVDRCAITYGTYTGQDVNRLHALDCARALVLRRLDKGYWQTIVVDLETNECVYPPPP
jgi:hypothetical protein